MTKKSKETTTELKPVEVVEKVLAAVAEEVTPEEETVPFSIENMDIPFLKSSIDKSAARPFRTKIDADGVVDVAGKVFTGRDVSDEEAAELKLTSWTRFDDNVLIPMPHRRSQSTHCYHHSQVKLKPADVKFKHYDIGGVDVYITNGSSLVVTERMTADSNWSEYPPTTIKPKLVIVGSEISTKSLHISGTVSLKNSSVVSTGMITMIDSTIDYSTINGINQYSTIDDSHLYGCYLHGQYSITLTDVDIGNVSLSGLKTIVMDRVSGGYDFNISIGSHQNQNNFSFRASNQYLHSYSACAYGRIGKGYEPVSDYDHFHETEWHFTVERRIDYGMFSATSPVPFVRVNQCDILVGDQLFSVKEFFPELVTKQEPPKETEYEQRPGGWGYTPPSPFPIAPFGGQYSRGSALWKKATSVAFGKDKAVIGKVGETIVNSLLDQIRSRINIYVEISTLN